jgi:hypothetical protein
MEQIQEKIQNANQMFSEAEQYVREQKTSRARFVLTAPDGDFEAAIQDINVPTIVRNELKQKRTALLGE